MSTPILVTGGSGTVGSRVAGGLLAEGLRVRLASRRPPGDAPSPAKSNPAAASAAESAASSVESVAFDFEEPATWDRAFDGVESVFLVRPPQLGRPSKDLLPAMDRARQLGVRRVVFLSTQGADRVRVVPHAAIERWLQGSRLAWTFLRASYFMQNLTGTHAAGIRAGRIDVPAGGGRIAYVDADDVAAVAVAALRDPDRHAYRAHTPTGPEALGFAEVAARLSALLGRPVVYTRPGVLRYVRQARGTMPAGMVAVTAGIYTAARLGLSAGLTGDVAELLGRPPVDFDTFARRERAVWEV